MPTAAAMSMSGRESKDVAAEIVSGIDVLGLTGPLKVRPHAYEIGPIVAADNGSGRRGGHQTAYRRTRRSLTPQPRKKGSFHEAQRQQQIHTVSRDSRRHRRERLRPLQQRQRLLVERARPG